MEGVWVNVPFIGRVFKPLTDLEARASEGGLMTFSAAAEALGHSRGWLRTQIDTGRIATIVWMGRTWVLETSVSRALEALGRPDEDAQRLEELESTPAGRVSWERQILVEQMQQEADDRERSKLSGHTTAELVRAAENAAPRMGVMKTATDLDNPLDSFLATYGGER